MMQRFCTWLWNMSEYWDIPLGNAAPWVLERMIGVKGERQE